MAEATLTKTERKPGNPKKKQQAPAAKPLATAERVLKVPVDRQPAQTFRLRIDLAIDGRDAEIIRQVTAALVADGARVNGHGIRNANDAMRWMIKQLASVDPEDIRGS